MPIYVGKVNSPYTTLASPITAIATQIPLVDAAVLPSATNICTIGFDQDNPETIKYEVVDVNTLKTVTREFDKEGTLGQKQGWPAGTKVSRVFTRWDWQQVVGLIDAQTLTNKRHQPRISSAASGDISPNVGTADIYIRTAQAAAITINNPTGSPAQGEKLIIRLKDNATPRAITWGGQYRGLEFALPATTVTSKTLYMGFIFNNDDTKWDMVAINQES